MDVVEAATLLTIISANDGREVTQAAALAWAEALPDVALDLAKPAVAEYYRTATRTSGRNWILPGDVLAGARRVHSANLWEAQQKAQDAALANGGDHDSAYQAGIAAMRALDGQGPKRDPRSDIPEAWL